ncbi:MAG: IS5 family transposase [Candidatus Competibacteraceae bacterium]|nr:MAG: IS5 family transposase [Candidatus Competibacteraceae bacterium]
MIKESLFAAEEREAKLDSLGDVLRVMEQHVDFKALAAEMDRVAPRPGRERGGRPPFPTELMVRAWILQNLYGLSDEQMEYQVLDRLSFQRFLGLRRSSQVPDRTTFWTFRERLTVAKAGDALFETVHRQLAQHGDIARGGQMVDASLVPVPRQHVTEEERQLIKRRAMPVGWKPAQRRQKDTEATWTQKHGNSTFGYKVSVSADRRYKLIRKVKVSTASENDTLHLEDVLDHANTGHDLYGDKGYVDGEREQRLKAQGWRVHIQRKAQKGKPLSACQTRRNTRIARIRARVEHVFAALEQMGGKLLRGIGLDRATFQLTGKAAVYNLRRLCSLKACGVVAF